MAPRLLPKPKRSMRFNSQTRPVSLLLSLEEDLVVLSTSCILRRQSLLWSGFFAPTRHDFTEGSVPIMIYFFASCGTFQTLCQLPFDSQSVIVSIVVCKGISLESFFGTDCFGPNFFSSHVSRSCC